MTEYGMGEVTVRIGTELSYKNEEIQTGTARSLLHYKERIWRSFILKMNPAAKAR